MREMDRTHSRRPWFFVVSSALIVGLLGALSSHCDTVTEDACEADLMASVTSLNDASTAFIAQAEALKLEIGTACHAIATDLEVADVPDVGADMSDEDLRAVCDLAQAAIEAEVSAGVTIDVAIEGGRCEVNAQAQFSCEAECTVEGECDPGSVEVRCDPGELSVQCEGSCDVNAVCQGTAEVAANCSGTCGGTCSGTCDGTAVEGSCEGTCEGTCTGECTVTADAGIECGADVRCRGGCTGTATAPSCEAELEPPSCDIDADCQAGCEGQASFEATCTPPSVAIVITGGAHANLEMTLTENLPALLNGFQYKGRLLMDAAADVVTSAGNVASDLSASALCAASVGAEVVGNLSAVASASASVTVSVEVSASVSGSASAN